jgi:hypothetical protein
MQNPMPVYWNMASFYKKSQNSYFLIFLTTRVCNTFPSQRIFFKKILSFFVILFSKVKRRSMGGEGGILGTT